MEPNRGAAARDVAVHPGKPDGVADRTGSLVALGPAVTFEAVTHTVVARTVTVALSRAHGSAAVRVAPSVLAETLALVAKAVTSAIVAVFTGANFTSVAGVERGAVTTGRVRVATPVARAAKLALR